MSISAYTGTCIFLTILAVIFRFLIAFKSVLEICWIDVEVNRRYAVVTKKANANVLAAIRNLAELS